MPIEIQYKVLPNGVKVPISVKALRYGKYISTGSSVLTKGVETPLVDEYPPTSVEQEEFPSTSPANDIPGVKEKKSLPEDSSSPKGPPREASTPPLEAKAPPPLTDLEKTEKRPVGRKKEPLTTERVKGGSKSPSIVARKADKQPKQNKPMESANSQSQKHEGDLLKDAVSAFAKRIESFFLRRDWAAGSPPEWVSEVLDHLSMIEQSGNIEEAIRLGKSWINIPGVEDALNSLEALQLAQGGTDWHPPDELTPEERQAYSSPTDVEVLDIATPGQEILYPPTLPPKELPQLPPNDADIKVRKQVANNFLKSMIDFTPEEKQILGLYGDTELGKPFVGTIKTNKWDRDDLHTIVQGVIDGKLGSTLLEVDPHDLNYFEDHGVLKNNLKDLIKRGPPGEELTQDALKLPNGEIYLLHGYNEAMWAAAYGQKIKLRVIDAPKDLLSIEERISNFPLAKELRDKIEALKAQQNYSQQDQYLYTEDIHRELGELNRAIALGDISVQERYNQLQQRATQIAQRDENKKRLTTEIHNTLAEKLSPTAGKWELELDEKLEPYYRAEAEKMISFAKRMIAGEGESLKVRINKIPPKTKLRAYYNKGNPQVGRKGAIHTGHSDNQKILFHELFHHLEATNKNLAKAANMFLRHRVGNEPPRKMKEMFPEHGFDDKELGRKDKFGKLFPDASAFYAGLLYSSLDTEVTAKLGELFLDNPMLLAEDQECLDYMIWVCAGGYKDMGVKI